ncbi:MAG: PecA family PE domain-processing aspartic protease [Mycobacterium sp.]
MTGRDGIKGKNRRRMAIVGGAVGAFAAAAAMATGSAVTAAPAKADFEDLLDPIIQPILTALTDSLAGFDPAAAADLTSWTDSFLSSLNALDVTAALPSAAEPAAALTTLSGGDVIPLSVQEGTEPTVDVSVDGSTPELTLVDTGSSGLLVPLNDLSLTQLFDLGFPTGINAVSFSGGIEAFYLEYNDATVGFGDGAVTTTNTPVDVAFFSFPTSFSAGSPLDFQQFLADNASPGGILGIGASGETGPGTGPFEAAGVSGVTVDAPLKELVLGPNAGTQIEPALNGAATPLNNLTETVRTSTGALVGTGSVSDDVDSGGVFGTIPSSLVGNAGSVPVGDTITVSDGNTVLYSYTVANDGVHDAPTVVSGTAIDSGFAPFAQEPIFISYGGTNADGAITFDHGTGTP